MFHSTTVTGVMGMRGCGKTFLSRRVQDLYPRVIVIDLLHEYTEDEYPDAHFVYSFEEFAQKLLETEHDSHFRIIYHVDITSDFATSEFDECMFLVYERGSVLVVIEEIQEYCSTHSIPRYLRQIFLLGRHRHVSVVFSTQRPGTLNKTLISQCHHVFIGRVYERNDVAYLAAFLGNEKANQLQTLPDTYFLHFQAGKESKVIKNTLTESELPVA